MDENGQDVARTAPAGVVGWLGHHVRGQAEFPVPTDRERVAPEGRDCGHQIARAARAARAARPARAARAARAARPARAAEPGRKRRGRLLDHSDRREAKGQDRREHFARKRQPDVAQVCLKGVCELDPVPAAADAQPAAQDRRL